jgi:hypothetical protein
MDLRERVAKLEAVVESLKHDIDRLYDAIERLREHTDAGLAELRDKLDAHMKWQMRLQLGIIAMIVGMFAKMLGLY